MPEKFAHLVSELVSAGAIRIDDGKLLYIGLRSQLRSATGAGTPTIAGDRYP